MSLGVKECRYGVSQLMPYIDWAYFMHAWQMPSRFASLGQLHQCQACRQGWLSRQQDKAKAYEALKLFDEAKKMLDSLLSKAEIVGRVALFDANSQGDDIVLWAQDEQTIIPCLRQQQVEAGEPNLCLADFIKPIEMGKDRIGIFATTVKFDVDAVFGDDAYLRMMAQTLLDRLAEAAACFLHKEVRCKIWGYAPNESLSIEELLREKNQGIRPAVGYPSLPDQSLNFLLSPLVGMEDMGISLTENGAMLPHATVSGLMISHPKSRYFGVGRIDENQLKDYAIRRNLPIERMRQFLSANLP